VLAALSLSLHLARSPKPREMANRRNPMLQSIEDYDNAIVSLPDGTDSSQAMVRDLNEKRNDQTHICCLPLEILGRVSHSYRTILNNINRRKAPSDGSIKGSQ
jgi:hypothetical protein